MAQTQLEWIEGGGITTPAGLRAGATYAGVRTYGDEPRYDLGVLVADAPAVVAGVFTRNAVVGEALRLTRERVATGRAQAIVVNSGNANTATGSQGAADARRMADLTAERLGIASQDVLVGSTGVIGRPLPMDLIEAGIASIEVAREHGAAFSRAIMTTDTRPKSAAVRCRAGNQAYTVSGTAKGSGMIHPSLATMFGFLTTDAPVEAGWLQHTLREICDRTFNMIDVDMDTSTCDMVIALAIGAAGGDVVTATHPAAPALTNAFDAVATYLARELARDGEGARVLIEVIAEGAASTEDARRAARTIASSPLVKTMVTGRDPNWGRVLMAAGRSGAAIDQDAASIWIGGHCAFDRGRPAVTDLALISQAMAQPELSIRVHLGAGHATATAWGCDLTEEYVRINADYTT